jgi:hypothetical protein
MFVADNGFNKVLGGPGSQLNYPNFKIFYFKTEIRKEKINKIFEKNRK